MVLSSKVLDDVLSGCQFIYKSKLFHKTDMSETAYLLGLRAKFPAKLFLKPSKHYFAITT